MKPKLAPEYEYEKLPDLTEENYSEYIKIAKNLLPRNNHLYKRVKDPQYEDAYAQREWQFEQIRRCKYGYKGMCGKEYFYFNFCWINNIQEGTLQPDFRVVDNEWFKLVESCEPGGLNEGKGIICIKKRRGGFSWKEAADAVHDGIFKKHVLVGMDSKTETDSKYLFRKCKFIYDNLPYFLKYPVQGSTSLNMLFAKKERDKNGSQFLTGNNSEVYSRAPTDNAHEGQMLNKWISDEAGKKPNLLTMWSYIEDTMRQETKRLGTPIIFGTAGDVDAGGAGIKKMWNKCDSYDLIPFFFAGWMGMYYDEYGNDNVEKAVDWVLKEGAKEYKKGKRSYQVFQQKYPLNAGEALQQMDKGSVGDPVKIKQQQRELDINPPTAMEGGFTYEYDGSGRIKPIFYPNTKRQHFGNCVIYEHPKEGVTYFSGSDPADHDNADNQASNLSAYIMHPPLGSQPSRIVFSFTDRPQDLNEYYNQYILALIYYNNARTLIEQNRYAMIRHFKNEGYMYLLKEEPQPPSQMMRKKVTRLGANKGKDTEHEMVRLINRYTEEYCHYIPDYELLSEFLKFYESNVDRAMAFAWTLIHIEDELRNISKPKRKKTPNPTFGLKKVNGVPVRYKKDKTN